MQRFVVGWCCLLACGWVVEVRALDTVRVQKAASAISGKITEMSPTAIVIEKQNGKTEKVAVNELESIRYDKEPAQLNGVRNSINNGRNEEALKTLDKLSKDSETDRDEIKADMDFYRALATARLALAGSGSLADAGKAMSAFLKAHADNYHFFQANETIGDLLVASAKYDQAETFYKNIEQKAPWPDYKMKAKVAMGRTLLKQAKGAEALTVFDDVLKLAEGQSGDLVTRQKLSASVGRAECLAQTGKTEEGVKLLESLITEADPEYAEMHALAYNALGNCYRKAGQKKEARMAFLHTHLLYSSYPEAHAESLANLSELFKELGDADRSSEMQELLTQRYASSKWAKK